MRGPHRGIGEWDTIATPFAAAVSVHGEWAHMYSIASFGSMIADSPRTDAYREALRRAIRPGSVVIDIGTGTGIFALSACQFGARKVYALEPGDAIEVARAMAQANGYGDRIEFHREISTNFQPQERADVIVSDLRGVLPMFQRHIPSILDARERLLSPGGVLIPQNDRLFLAAVEAPELYRRRFGVWRTRPYGLDMTSANQSVVNAWVKGRAECGSLVTDAQCWGMLDYRSITDPNVAGAVAITAKRAATVHGLALWFDATLAEGVGYSNDPREPELIYGNAFFPWPEPVELSEGDRITVQINADLVDDEYIWRWRTKTPGAAFDQSTFYAAPLAVDRLRKRASGYRPRLNEDGRVDHWILALFDGERPLEQISQLARERFPSRFPTVQRALAYVADLSQRYGCHAESSS